MTYNVFGVMLNPTQLCNICDYSVDMFERM